MTSTPMSGPRRLRAIAVAALAAVMLMTSGQTGQALALGSGHPTPPHGPKQEQGSAEGLPHYIPEASTFLDRAIAESSLADVQLANESEIQAWLAGAKPGAKRAFSATFDDPVGRILYGGSSGSVEGSTAIAVLRADPSSPIGYYILTGYVAP